MQVAGGTPRRGRRWDSAFVTFAASLYFVLLQCMCIDRLGVPDRNDTVAYVLLVAALIITAIGFTRLRPSGLHQTPWGALFLWAVLLAIGGSVWLFAARVP